MSLVRPEEQLSQEGTALVRAARELAIVDDVTYAVAGERRKLVKTYLTEVEAVMGPIVRAADHAHTVAVRQREMLKAPALEADGIYKTGRLAYETEQHRLRQEAEAAARRERERLEAEALAAAIAEGQRLREAEETRRLEAAAELEAAGDAEAADRLLAEPVNVPAVLPMPVFWPPVDLPAPPAKVEGISSTVQWDFEIEDPSLVPREFLTIDLTKIRGVVRALKELARIPGVRVISRRNESVRARA